MKKMGFDAAALQGGLAAWMEQFEVEPVAEPVPGKSAV